MFEMRVKDPRSFLRPLFLLLVVALLLVPTIAQAQVTIKVNDNISFRLGTLIQAWADSAQDPATKSNAKNLFLRRFRFLVGGQISPTVSFFFETDNPNLGKAPKALGSGFITQDAFVEWKPLAANNAFILDAGLMLPPLCRNCLESAATLLSLDYGSFSFTESAATQSSVGRDTGFQAKGYLAGGHFEYRAALFQGFRAAPVAKNSLRTTARLMYNVWDTETGYVYPGLYLGNKRILSVGGGIDRQQNYKAYAVDGFVSMPMAKNALNAEITLLKFDGGTTFTAAIPEQRDATLQAGYYLGGPKFMPFLRYENQNFTASSNNARDNKRYQAGLTWLPNGNNFNIKGAYSRIAPNVGNKTNQYTIQMQFFYY
jgi:hypothetical protein